jgi:hypothetical protein
VVKRIGILTGGGDVPGLNSVIKSATYRSSENGTCGSVACSLEVPIKVSSCYGSGHSPRTHRKFGSAVEFRCCWLLSLAHGFPYASQTLWDLNLNNYSHLAAAYLQCTPLTVQCRGCWWARKE